MFLYRLCEEYQLLLRSVPWCISPRSKTDSLQKKNVTENSLKIPNAGDPGEALAFVQGNSILASLCDPAQAAW